MGLILDSSLLIASERRGQRVWDILERVRASQGETETALSAITVIELTHGIYRANSESNATRRRAFVDEVLRAIPVQPLTLEVAQLAGKIEGEQAAKGIIIPLPDLLIGTTALHSGFGVATLNLRDFHRIPGLSVVQL